MPSIRPYQQGIFQARLNFEEYWDFVVCPDCQCSGESTDCLAALIDTNNPDCVRIDSILSLPDHHFSEATNKGLTLSNIGLTGVDNGFIHYAKDTTTNEMFNHLFVDSQLKLDEGDLSLHLYRVHGNNDIFDYPNSMVMIDDDVQVAKLNGGFFQGFFKTPGCGYQVLPSTIDRGLRFTLTLYKSDFLPDSEHTLNDKYPDNKGIFLYIGTRAENKWWTLYNVPSAFPNSGLTYTTEGYVDNEYVVSCNADTFYIKDAPQPSYLDMEYLSDDYYAATPCCPCQSTQMNTSTSSGGHHYNFTYPEALAVYQDNAIWYDEHGCVMVDNELWKTKWSREWSGKSVAQGDCTGRLFDGYVEADYYVDEYASLGYLLDDGYLKPDAELLTDANLTTADGYPIAQPNIRLVSTDNKFLLFSRAKDGFQARDWDGATEVVLHDIDINDQANYFLLTSCNGYTVHDLKARKTAQSMTYDVLSDLYRNALAFQIKDDGRIGYKYLVKDCEAEDGAYAILSEFSLPDVVPSDMWVEVSVVIQPVNTGQMQFWFYVDNKLRFVSRPMDKLNLHALNDLAEKQEGVPFNISVGGGTQGLGDVVYADFRSLPQWQLPLEKCFAGSFIGYIREFKAFECGNAD